MKLCDVREKIDTIPMDEFIEELKKADRIKNNQLERFKNKYSFEMFVDKVINKYYSKKYRDRWLNRGFEPQEELFWFLFSFAEKYGRECNKKEWDKMSNSFTTEMYYCNGYYFMRIDGQGSLINITKNV